jgi:hypothetical protein
VGSATLTNVTITANSSGLASGGISNSGGTTRLENTLVANASLPAGQDCFGAITSAGGNLDSGTSCGFSTLTDISNTDLLLGPLTANGGRTPTHALLVGSPALDTAQQSHCPATDQRLVPRPQGPGCDIGAYELLQCFRGPSHSVHGPGFASAPGHWLTCGQWQPGRHWPFGSRKSPSFCSAGLCFIGEGL